MKKDMTFSDYNSLAEKNGMSIRQAYKEAQAALEVSYRGGNTDLLDGLSDLDTKVFLNTSIQKGPDLFYMLNFKLIYIINSLNITFLVNLHSFIANCWPGSGLSHFCKI